MAAQKIIFLGAKSIGFDCFEYLISKCKELDIEIVGYMTNNKRTAAPNKNMHTLATQYEIPCIENLDLLPSCDIIYSVQYHEILSQKHIDQAKHIAVNLHMAPLPEYRGCNQFSMAILEEKKEFGTTIHRIDHRIDHGDILFESRFAIPENCWVEELYNLTYTHSILLFKESLKKIIEKDYSLTPQAAWIDKRGTSLHFRNEINDLKLIDLSWDANKIERHFRACYMPGFEPPYTIINNQKIYFSKEWAKG